MTPIRKHLTRSAFHSFVLLAALGSAPSARAACFDFSSRVNERLPLPTPLKETPGSPDLRAKGTKAGQIHWAAIQGKVDHPIKRLLTDLIAHGSTKSSRVDEMRIDKVADENNDLRQRVSFTVRPFPLMKVQWEEDWGFVPLSGTLGNPDALLVSYEKTSGTPHIKHLCGNILLRKLSPSSTRVFVYQETLATRRTEEETMNGVAGVLHNLRLLPPVDPVKIQEAKTE